MKSKTYTQSKRPLDKNQSSKFCQSGVKQTHFQNLKEKRNWFFWSQGHFKRKVHTSRFFRKDTKKNKQFHRATANSYHSTAKFTTEIHIFYFFHRIQGHSTLGVRQKLSSSLSSCTLPPVILWGSGKASSKAKPQSFSELTLHWNQYLKKTTHNSNKEYATGVIHISLVNMLSSKVSFSKRMSALKINKRRAKRSCRLLQSISHHAVPHLK